MAAHIAFLRAINLGRNRRLAMPLLKEVLSDAGFTAVETYLATGNVRVESPRRSRRKVEQEIEAALEAAVGFDVPTIVLSPTELRTAYDEALATGVTAQRRYLTFLKEDPSGEVVAEIDRWRADGEGARVVPRAVYWWIDHPNAVAKMSNSRIEKLAGTATTRDLKVVTTLTQRWCS